MRVIDADVLQNLMYHEAFEIDSDMQKWDSGCWIRYKVFENCLEKTPTLDDYNLDQWCDDCKEYDHEKHCCPRFNRVIRKTVSDFKKEHYKSGTWVLDEKLSKEHVEHIYFCSACHNNEAWGETERTRYCSYCGAEMENWT